MATATTPARPPLPPFTRESAIQKVRLAEDGWNSRDPAKVALAYTIADEMRFAASNVTGGIVPNSGHWIIEENPQATIKLVTDFLAK